MDDLSFVNDLTKEYFVMECLLFVIKLVIDKAKPKIAKSSCSTYFNMEWLSQRL